MDQKLIPLHNDVNTLQELIEIREGYKECIDFTKEDINNFITCLYTYTVCLIYFFLFYVFLLLLKLPLWYCYACIILGE